MSSDHSKFTVIPTESIKLYADQIGITNLTDEATESLAQDVTHRIQALIQSASNFMMNSRRKKLTCNDINRALEWSDCELVYGFANHNNKEIKSVNNKEAKVFVTEDNLIDLNEEADKIMNKEGGTLIKMEQFTLEVKDVRNFSDDLESENQCSDQLIEYYKRVTNAIEVNDIELLEKVFDNISINPKISAILPQLISFISNGIQRFNIKSQFLHLLDLIEALLKNKFIPVKAYLEQLIENVINCLVGSFDCQDHWSVRDKAALFLRDIFCWCVEMKNDYLIKQTIDELTNDLMAKPFHNQYGVLKLLLNLNYHDIEKYFCPILNQYLNWFKNIFDKRLNQDNSHKLYGILSSAVRIILIRYRKQTISFEQVKDINEMYDQINDIFGDSLIIMLPTDFDDINKKCYIRVENELRLFETAELNQTGEELLDKFYEDTNKEESNSSGENQNQKDKNTNKDKLQRKSTTIIKSGIKLRIRLENIKRNVRIQKDAKKKTKIMIDPDEPRFENVKIHENKPIRINIKGIKLVVNLKL